MNDMKKDTYTLWIDDELVATRDHNRDGYNDLLAYAQEHLANSPEIHSSREEQAVWWADMDADEFRDMMPSSEEFYADAMGPEPYEPSCYDGTYSEM